MHQAKALKRDDARSIIEATEILPDVNGVSTQRSAQTVS